MGGSCFDHAKVIGNAGRATTKAKVRPVVVEASDFRFTDNCRAPIASGILDALEITSVRFAGNLS